MRARIATAAVVLGLAASSCSSHDPYCKATTVHCVETCGGAPFIQCGACPDGSVTAEECADGGS